MKEIKVENLFQYINPMKLNTEPAIALASDGKETNGLTIGWAEFGRLWRKPAMTVYVHKARYSKHIFDGADYYSVCFMEPEQKNVLGYFGTVSGRDENKMKNCGLTVLEEDGVPYFAESRAVVICRIMGRNDFDVFSCDDGVKEWYLKDGVHTLYHGEIIKVLVKE